MTDHHATTVEILAALEQLRAHDVPTHGGRTLAYVYDSGLAEADALGREALAAYGATNALDPTAFPSLLRMEQDLIGLAAGLLHGAPGAVGSVTSGGTESVLLAVQAARDAHPEITTPAMVLPTSAHAAFHKAAHYFGVRPVFVDVDPGSCRADAASMAAAITADTVLVVASAPSYAHGVVDPVPQIAADAGERGIRCHVDACIGGWLLPFLPDAPPFDFAVEGVTSISVDLHKYGYTPKGVSLLLHRDAELRRPQLFASAAWPGYTMLNSTLQSTKSGGPVAAAWAVTRLIGVEGYTRLAGEVRTATLALAEVVSGLHHLRVIAAPDTSLLAVAADEACDVFTIGDELGRRGWYAQAQLSFGDFPPTLHFSLSAATAPLLPELTAALADAVGAAVAQGPIRLDQQLAGLVRGLDPSQLDASAFAGLLGAAGLVGADGSLTLPDRFAPVNALLDVASPELREAIMLAFLDNLARP